MILDERFLCKQVRVLGIDLDGVVYQGNRLLPGAAEAIERLTSMGYVIEYLTNNSFRSSAETEAKLNRLGIKLGSSRVINSIDAVHDLLQGLSVQAGAGFHVIGSPALTQMMVDSGYQITPANESQYLVVGFNPDFTYQTICAGLDALQHGATFIACNEEANYPDENDHLKPGCGALVVAIAASAGHAPDHVAGKPSMFMLERVMNRYKCSAEEILVIGDTLESDILMANKFGSFSAWISNRENCKTSENVPTFIIKSLSELPDALIQNMDKR